MTKGLVFLAVTGGEALYADLGHFGRKPIQAGWFFLVLPALLLNHFGQGALVLSHPAAIENSFYRMVPETMPIPLILLATAATVIASQAVITGAFFAGPSAVQLGLLPRFEVRFTSETHAGQIYLPRVNRLLLIGRAAPGAAVPHLERTRLCLCASPSPPPWSPTASWASVVIWKLWN